MGKFSREIWLLGLAAIFFFLQSFFQRPKPQDQISYVAPPVEVKYLSSGFAVQSSDLFWMRLIQDTEYCERHADEKSCEGKSWFYQIVNLSIELDPLFDEAYYYGGLSLTVLIKDQIGAADIFDRAVKVFKYEWPILYLAAYHALFEQKDRLKASKLYLRAAENGAPAWVRLSAGKLASDAGDGEAAREILNRLIGLESNPLWIKSLQEKIESMPGGAKN